MVVLYWFVYVMNCKKLNRKSVNGIGIRVMVRKLKKILNFLGFLIVWVVFFLEVIGRLVFCFDGIKVIFYLFLLLFLLFFEECD